MAERLPPEPSPAARELLRAFREHESPARRERERGWQALQARLELDPAQPSAAANGGYYVKVVAVTLGLAAAVLLTIKGVGAGVTALADQARQPAMEAPYQGEAGSEGGTAKHRAPRALPPRRGAGQAPAGGVATPVAEPPSSAEPEVATDGATERGSTPRARSSASAGPSSNQSGTLTMPTAAADIEAELALIKRAKAAKQHGRHADGLAALREHAERFARGTLADERVVLRAELLCAAGRVDEARSEARAFLRERADSALAGRMRHVCSDSRKPWQEP